MPGDTPTSWHFSFYVSAPREWSAGLTERVRHHFAVFNLADLNPWLDREDGCVIIPGWSLYMKDLQLTMGIATEDSA